MWNNDRSLLLSRGCTVIAGAALAAILAGGPWVVRWLVQVSAGAYQWQTGFFLATIYSGGVFAAILLYCLFRLLHNIGGGVVFVPSNVAYLRRISWCCIGGCAVCLASGIYYVPWILVGLAAGFVGLIVRVVKNVVNQAVVLKEENDLTI